MLTTTAEAQVIVYQGQEDLGEIRPRETLSFRRGAELDTVPYDVEIEDDIDDIPVFII